MGGVAAAADLAQADGMGISFQELSSLLNSDCNGQNEYIEIRMSLMFT